MQAAALASSIGFALAGGVLTGRWRWNMKYHLGWLHFLTQSFVQIKEKSQGLQKNAWVMKQLISLVQVS